MSKNVFGNFHLDFQMMKFIYVITETNELVGEVAKFVLKEIINK